MSEVPGNGSRLGPPGVQRRANIARVNDAALGGKDNYEIDREVLAQARRVAPEVADLAVSNRKFLLRVVRFLVDRCGIRQVVDCGAGLPTTENTHQVAQRVAPDTVVVYVNSDPVVFAHGQALLTENELTHFISANIFRPDEVLGHEVVYKHLDLTEPVALLQVGTLHHYLGSDGGELMRQYVEALPSGSYVAVSHFFDPETPELTPLARGLEESFLTGPMASGRFRTRAELSEFLPGLEIIPPGPGKPADWELSDLWWPEGPRLRPLNAVQQCIAAAVARKP
ncbi:SAM-dependent methyltransferase [Actinophytocola xanthii]|uniref:SAM-dependent methyltransferase n=1 Tax=Actinophytocola xanthii TaxID=1912961 RepID=A0A1Q8CH02_9PSEU|nr:SAM-dependent methyltransferase [Actinophytocola xanthii]OLF13592.1 hypothetical protein BU204_26465 [Actinophytocola xanthii]